MYELTAPFTSSEVQALLQISDEQYDQAVRSGYLQATGTIREAPPCALLFHTFWDMLRYEIFSIDLKDIIFNLDAQVKVDAVLNDLFDMFENYSPEIIIPSIFGELFNVILIYDQNDKGPLTKKTFDQVNAVFSRLFWKPEEKKSTWLRQNNFQKPELQMGS